MWLGILDEIDGMDQMNFDLMMRSGVTLERLATKSRDEELRAREVSRMKVEEWRGGIADTAPGESENSV